MLDLYIFFVSETLVFDGYKITATCGMDLHDAVPMGGKFATYIKSDGISIANDTITAIKTGQTWVSKGFLLVYENDKFSIVDMQKNGAPTGDNFIVTLTTKDGCVTHDINNAVSIENTTIAKLYVDDTSLENLVCIAPVIYGN
ncbi:MAG: hypothetical protein ATN35_13160 [Epulopiscium sp. Nele67-Bin004]|nr:MAG: hypothetical protein ATN35_13160 [Epulopiscium sp. Nele67-Bin004]